MTSTTRYRFGDSARVGVLLGMPLRQVLPVVIGVLWLTAMLMAGLPLVGAGGPVAGAAVSLGRWRRAPLYEVAVPGARLAVARARHRSAWSRASLLADNGGSELPSALRGLELRAIPWAADGREAGVIYDRAASTVSLVIPVQGEGFPVASSSEQDVLVASWGAVLSPLARARCPVSRVTWQEWSHPSGVAAHDDYRHSVGRDRQHVGANSDYERLLSDVAPFTVAHEVLVTVTVDLRRIKSRRGSSTLELAVDELVEEVRQLLVRLETGGFTAGTPLAPADVATAVRRRSDPARTGTVRHSLASAAGRAAAEWGPMAVEPGWFETRVDGSWHRTFRVAAWPMLPVAADWMGPLMTGDDAVRTVTVVFEPVSLAAAAQEANRHLTSIEADHEQKERHGFRLTARERRRQADVETRERELAEGHPLFRHVAFVTVTAGDLEALDEACNRVEQSAAQSLLDLRPLAARQAEGWVASLPLGRSVRNGSWK